jgi:hypothetical protein
MFGEINPSFRRRMVLQRSDSRGLGRLRAFGHSGWCVHGARLAFGLALNSKSR